MQDVAILLQGWLKKILFYLLIYLFDLKETKK